MINQEEFELFFDNWDKQRAAEKVRYKSFMNSYMEGLISFTVGYYPEIKEHLHHFIKPLKQEIEDGAHCTYETLEFLTSKYAEEDTTNPDNYKIPDHVAEDAFFLGCHNKVKEVIYEYFPEIMELSGNHIRYINFSSYVKMSLYKEGFYYVTVEYRDDAVDWEE